MAIDTPARHIYTGNGNQRVFPIPTKIIGDDYIRIEIDGVYQSDRSKWDIVNNSIIFTVAPLNNKIIDVQVATSEVSLAALGTSTNVDTVATNIASITEVASLKNEIINLDSIKNDIVNVSGMESKIDTVNASYLSIKNVSDNIVDVTNVSNISSKVVTVADNITVINIANSNATNINTVASNIDNINTVSLKIPEITTVAGSISNINTVAGSNGNISTVVYNIANVNNVAGNITNINSVNSNASNINNVASNIVNVANVGSNITKVNAVYDDIVKGYRTHLTFLYPNVNYTAVRFTLTDNTTVSVNINGTNPSSWISTIQANASYIASVKNTILSIDAYGYLNVNDKSTTEFSNIYKVNVYNAPNSSWINPSYWDTVSAIIRVSDNLPKIQDVANYMLSKQDLLVSGTNIKTLNGINLLGSGNIDLGSAGLGDMVKATYDTNNNGIVDNAEKVNGYTVDTNVPADAIFTDTVYNDTELRGRVVAIENTAYVIDTEYVHTDNNFTTILKDKLDTIANGAEVNVNADWNATGGDAEILNKPNSVAGYGIIDVYSKPEIDSMIGDINSALDTINGEVI